MKDVLRNGKSVVDFGIRCFAATIVLLGVTTVAQAQAEELHPPSQPKLALALGGGGAKAAGHVGFLRVLEREHIKVNAIAGTSVGGVVGALYAAGVPLDTIEHYVVDGQLRKAMVPPLPKMVLSQLIQVIGRKSYAGVVSGKRYRRFLQKCLGDETCINDLPMPFISVATDLNSGKECHLKTGNLSRSLVASSALTPLFKPQELDGKLLIDGGVRSNLPVKAAHETGADIVIGVSVDTSIPPIPAERMRSMRRLTGRISDIYIWSQDAMRIPNTDMTVWINEDDVRTTDHKKKIVQHAIAQGEKAAELALPKIRALIAERGKEQTAHKPQASSQVPHID